MEAGQLVQVAFYARIVSSDNAHVSVKTVGRTGEVITSLPASVVFSAATFGADDKVEADFKGKGKWFPAKVLRLRDDDTYDILYDDGDKELGIPLSRVRARDAQQQAFAVDPSTLKTDTHVEGRYKGKSKFYAAKVTAVNGDGTVDLEYTDGDVEANVPLDRLRHPTATATTTPTAADVSATSQSKPGSNTTSVNRSGSGAGRGSTQNVSLRAAMKAARQSVTGTADAVGHRTVYAEKQRVECNYRGKGVWYLGEISYYREDDAAYNVEFDDPKLFKEYKVPPEYVRPVLFREGERVEGNFRNAGMWHLGVVTCVHDDKTAAPLYNVEYDDPMLFKEFKVVAKRLRAVRFSEGQRVECMSTRRKRWESATVTCYREEDDTYNVEYDSEELFKEWRVSARRLRPLVFKVGDRVEAKYKGGDMWYPCVVSYFRDDEGTYNVEYDDERLFKEYKVPLTRLRWPPRPADVDNDDVSMLGDAMDHAGCQPSRAAPTPVASDKRDDAQHNRKESDKVDQATVAKEIAAFLESDAVGMSTDEAKKTAHAALGRGITSTAHLGRMMRVVDFAVESIHMTKEQGEKLLSALRNSDDNGNGHA